MKHNVGDIVYWNDPDRGLYSGYHKITSIVNRDIVVLDHGTEVFIWELSCGLASFTLFDLEMIQ